MSLNLNTVVLAGHLTRDPEVRSLSGEKVVTNFSLAINRRYKGADGEIKEESTFVECEAWGRTAELIGQYLNKGSAAYCEGRLRLDSWQDKEGQKRNRLKVVVENVQFLGAPRGKGQSADHNEPAAMAAASPMTAKNAGKTTIGLDEPPF